MNFNSFVVMSCHRMCCRSPFLLGGAAFSLFSLRRCCRSFCSFCWCCFPLLFLWCGASLPSVSPPFGCCFPFSFGVVVLVLPSSFCLVVLFSPLPIWVVLLPPVLCLGGGVGGGVGGGTFPSHPFRWWWSSPDTRCYYFSFIMTFGNKD